jgi:protein SCO1
MSNGSVRRVSVIIAILLLPCIVFLVLLTGKHRIKPLEILGPIEVSEKGDTIYHTVPDFHFINQEGKEVSQENLEGKIYVADFFFASCPSICPKMTDELSRIAHKFRNQKSFMIISHTVNPDKDLVPVLAEYAKRFKADPKKWYFVTGDKKEIYDIARNGYFITASKGDGGPDDFIHDPGFVLIDKEKRIRAYCDDGTDPAKVDTLIDKIRVLLAEYRIKTGEKEIEK